MQLNNISIKALFFLGVISLSSCLPEKQEDILTYNGTNQVEFKNHTLGQSTAVLTQKGIVTAPATQAQTELSRAILINTRVVDTIYVQLIKEQSSTAISVPFQVRSSSTAVEGTHYNFVPANSRTVTIPANSSVGYLLVQPVANSIATTGDTRTILLDLSTSGTVAVSPNYSSFTLTLKR